MEHIQPIQSVQKSNNNLYNLDGSTLYDTKTGNLEGDISEISFNEVYEKVLKEEK